MSLNNTIPEKKSCFNCGAWRQSIFKDFNEKQLLHLNSIKHPNVHKKSENLFKQGEEVKGIYCNASGLLKVIQKNDSDKIIFSRFVFPGDTVGHRSIFVEDKYKGTCEVISDKAEACFVNKRDVLNLFSQSNEFAKALIFKISADLESSVNDHILLSESTAFARLCTLLLKLFDEYSEEKDGLKCVKCNITKVDIARCLSMADETVIRFMSELQKDKIVHTLDKKLVLLNEAKLRQYA